MGKKTISVVTPSFNQGEFIEDTIKSVLSQRGDFYIEYLIMDGGSKDASVDIIKKYDEKLRSNQWPISCLGISYAWVSEKDKGQVDALIKGFSRVRGDICVWLNSDDVFYDENAFATVVSGFGSNDIDMLIGDGLIIDRAGHETAAWHTDRIDLKELVILDYHILQPSVFLRKTLIDEFPIDRGMNYAFDADLFIKIIRSGKKYKKIEVKLSSFRMYPEIKTLTGKNKIVKELMVIARRYTSNPLLLFICRVYKYLSIVVVARYADSRLIKSLFSLSRNLCYLAVLGTWGRR